MTSRCWLSASAKLQASDIEDVSHRIPLFIGRRRSDCERSAAAGGTSINTVLLTDLDGDGDKEILATLDRTGLSGLTKDAVAWLRNTLRRFAAAERGHSLWAVCAAWMNARTFSGSFRPGEISTPVLTSTPQGRTVRIASATFAAVKPPARSQGGQSSILPVR